MSGNTIRLFFLFSIISSFGISLFFAITTLFFLGRGLNFMEIAMVESVFAFAVLLFEIPTGAVADVFGRKCSYVLACFFWSASMFVMAFSESIYGFIACEFLAAIGCTFESGAFVAWLVDRLKYCDYEGSMLDIFARNSVLAHMAKIIGAFSGSILFGVSDGLPWFASGIVLLFNGILALFLMKEEYFEKKNISFRENIRKMVETAKISFDFTRQNKVMRFLALMGVLYLFAVQTPNQLWQPVFSSLFSGSWGMGLIFTMISLGLTIGSWLAPKIIWPLGGEKNAITICQIAMGLGIFLTVCFQNIFVALFFFLAHEIWRGMIYPIREAYLNDHISSTERATLNSFNSMFHHFGGIVGLVVCGAAAQEISIKAAWFLAGGILMFFSLIVWKFFRK